MCGRLVKYFIKLNGYKLSIISYFNILNDLIELGEYKSSTNCNFFIELLSWENRSVLKNYEVTNSKKLVTNS